MGQYWQLVNIDRWASLTNTTGDHKLGGIVEDRWVDQLLSMLRRHKWVAFKGLEDKLSAAKSATSSPLVSLPQEMIDLVVTSLADDVSDDTTAQAMTNLALSCTYFLRLLAPKLQNSIASDIWAGDRLIFVGDYAEGYPPDVASEEEKFEWAKPAYSDSFGRANPFYLVDEEEDLREGQKLGKIEGEEDYSLVRRFNPHGLTNEDDQRRFDMLLKLLTREPERDESSNRPVLRNLTEKQYVRDEAIAKSMPEFTLGDIIIALGLWTADPSGTEGLGCEGEWAGHRFDIATMADVEGWEDASERAVKQLRILYEPSFEREAGRRA